MILIDTNVFVAYYNEQDTTHKRAVSLLKEIFLHKYGLPITTDYVFDEAVTVTLRRTKNKDCAIALGNSILTSEIRLLRIHEGIFQEAWNLFQTQKISFTDCTLVAAMRALNIEYLATFDETLQKVKGVIPVC